MTASLEDKIVDDLGIEYLRNEGILRGLSDVSGDDFHEIAEVVLLVLVVSLLEIRLFLHVLDLDAVGQTLHDLFSDELGHVRDDLQGTLLLLVARQDAVLRRLDLVPCRLGLLLP